MSKNGQNIKLPPEFSGPAQFVLYTRYGDPREPGWEHKWIDNWHIRKEFPWFPEESISIHKHFRPILQKALRELEIRGLHEEIKTCDGCTKLRNAPSDTSVLSLHAWGAALDLNAKDNPHGSVGKWSEKFIEIMTAAGVYCGQNWEGRKDPMHFAMLDG